MSEHLEQFDQVEKVFNDVLIERRESEKENKMVT